MKKEGAIYKTVFLRENLRPLRAKKNRMKKMCEKTVFLRENLRFLRAKKSAKNRVPP